MESKPQNDTTPLPDFLGKEAKVDPIPRLRALIEQKMKHFHNLNNRGIKLVDDQITRTFDTVLDQRLQDEVIDDMKRFKKGRSLSKEGLAYKNELESNERQQNPTLKLADLIVNKIAGMDALSDEELEELDISIQTAHTEAQEVDKLKADSIMTRYFTDGRRLTPIANAWLKDKYNVVNHGPGIGQIIDEERESLKTGVKSP